MIGAIGFVVGAAVMGIVWYVKDYCFDCLYLKGYSRGYKKAESDLLPAAQPEIIRCKDCKHRDPEDKKCDCGHDIRWQLPRHDDWHCADAERRIDDKTNKGSSC